MCHFVYWTKTFTQDTEFPSQEIIPGNSLMVQWLRLGVFTAVGLGLTPGQGTKIPQAMQHSRKEGRKEEVVEWLWGFWQICVQSPALLVTNTATWGKGFKLSELQFPHLPSGDTFHLLPGLPEDMEMVGCSGKWFCPRKVLGYCLCFCKMCASFWKKKKKWASVHLPRWQNFILKSEEWNIHTSWCLNGIWIPTQPFTGHVTLNEWLNLPLLHFLACKMREEIFIWHIVFSRDNYYYC